MGWFKKKSDPITERSRALTDQIAHLEAQIRDLTSQTERAMVHRQPAAPVPEPPPEACEPEPPLPPPTPRQKVKASSRGQQPRLRSTAFPQGSHIPATTALPTVTTSNEPIFEEGARNPFKGSTEKSATAKKELDVRKNDFGNSWRRFKNHFRGPATSNPKLVNYLAAGSIQGLRPLRYEKRVARNRFILLLVALSLVVWGIIALVLRR